MGEDCQTAANHASTEVVEASDTAKTQELVDEDLERRRRYHRIGTHWKKPPSKVYADNFGFGVNGYQCMIDYLDEKDYYGKNPRSEKVHLPLLEERCLDSYSSRKPFRFYNNEDINDFIVKGDNIRSQIRQNDVVEPGNVLTRTHTNWSMTKKYVQGVKKSNVVDYRKLRAERELAAEGIYIPDQYKPIGVTFALNTMDSNLTLYKAHNNLDHAIYMNSRRERMADIDHQFDTVVSQLTDGADDLNRRAQKELRSRSRSNVITQYDKAQNMAELANITEDLAARNRLRRQLEFQALEDGVDDIMRLDTARNRFRNNMRSLNDTVKTMEDEVSVMRRRHREERAEEYATPAAIRNEAQRKARLALNLSINDEDLDDPDLARLRMRKAHAYAPLDDPAVLPFHKYRSDPEVVSDVQSRVLQRAGEIAGQTSIQRHVNNRARYVNIYVPKYNTADPDLIVKPSRTELNIDHMAKSLAQKGRIQRRFDVDEETDLPVSNLNTYAYRQYCKKEANKPIDQVPSNSLRVRSAVCRARERTALQGY